MPRFTFFRRWRRSVRIQKQQPNRKRWFGPLAMMGRGFWDKLCMLKADLSDFCRLDVPAWFRPQESPRPRRTVLGFEMLENRLTPAVTASFGSNVLTITGDTGNNNIRIYSDVDSNIKVTENGSAVTITGGPAALASTTSIVATGSSGNDSIWLDEANGALPNCSLDGGAGNDTLLGASGNDTLYGDVNNDRLFGVAGNDSLLGGNDQDSLDGGAGNDALAGGSGNDTLYGAAGNDSLLGEDGHDSLFGGADNDILTDVSLPEMLAYLTA